MTGTALCICGGRSERFPDSDRPCVCYGKARNSACTCVVNPGGQDGLLYDQDCPAHARPSSRATLEKCADIAWTDHEGDEGHVSNDGCSDDGPDFLAVSVKEDGRWTGVYLSRDQATDLRDWLSRRLVENAPLHGERR